LSAAILYACSKRQAAVPENEEIKFVTPANFPGAVYKFEDNPLTQKVLNLAGSCFTIPDYRLIKVYRAEVAISNLLVLRN
jgi:hypothetical protein